jgi:hypothetical protein
VPSVTTVTAMKPGRFSKLRRASARVLKALVKQRPTPRGARGLCYNENVPEIAPGPPVEQFVRHGSVFDPLNCIHPQMRGNFVLKILFLLVPAQKRSQTVQNPSHSSVHLPSGA